MPAVEVLEVSKCFGRGESAVQALDRLSLSIPSAGVYGLLGPNGAGKSTLLRIVTGLVHADSGSVGLFGAPACPASRRRLGALIEAPTFYPFLTARELLRVLAATSGAAGGEDHDALLARVGLAGASDRAIAGFSLGMKQRLGIAAALVARPEILILDEPTNGLDPDGIAEIRELVRTLADRDGIAILLSSHQLDEVERICDRVAILNQGRLAAEGRVDELLAAGERLWIDALPRRGGACPARRSRRPGTGRSRCPDPPLGSARFARRSGLGRGRDIRGALGPPRPGIALLRRDQGPDWSPAGARIGGRA